MNHPFRIVLICHSNTDYKKRVYLPVFSAIFTKFINVTGIFCNGICLILSQSSFELMFARVCHH